MKALKQNIKNQLLTLNIPTYITRVRPKDIEKLPIIVIYNDSYRIENEIPNYLGFAGNESKSVVIDICYANSDNFSDLLDDAVKDCLALLVDSDFMKNNRISADSIDVKYSYTNDFERPLAIASITLAARGFNQL